MCPIYICAYSIQTIYRMCVCVCVCICVYIYTHTLHLLFFSSIIYDQIFLACLVKRSPLFALEEEISQMAAAFPTHTAAADEYTLMNTCTVHCES